MRIWNLNWKDRNVDKKPPLKLYALSGLGADARVYKSLHLPYPTTVLSWTTPASADTLGIYAAKLLTQIDTDEKFGLIGVSFGGMLAVEIAKISSPVFVILISSAVVHTEVPFLYRFVGKIGPLPLLPKRLFLPPTWFAAWLFGTKKKELLRSILADTDLNFAKWAACAIVQWRNADCPKNYLSIQGTADKILPAKHDTNTLFVDGGGHLMIVDRAAEVNAIIQSWLRKHSL